MLLLFFFKKSFLSLRAGIDENRGIMYDDNAIKQSYTTFRSPLPMPVKIKIKISKKRAELLAIIRKAYAKIHGTAFSRRILRTVWVQHPNETRISVYAKTYERR